MNKKTVLLRIVCFCLLVLLGLSPIGNFTPHIKAVSLSDIAEEISPPSASPRGIGVDSQGNIYYGDYYGNLYKSTDNGYSWTCVFNDINTSGHRIYYIFVDSKDNVFFLPQVDQDIYKYNGTTTMVKENTRITWHWDEGTNGSVYVNSYDIERVAWRTDDEGETWEVCFNATELGASVKHLHSIKVDPITDEVYVLSGDGPDECFMFRYNGSWHNMGYFIRDDTPVCDTWFDDDYVYIGADTNDEKVIRMAHSESDITNWDIMVYGKDWDTPSPDLIRWGEKIGELMFFVTCHGEIWSSWDGAHWYMIYQNTEYNIGIYDVPEQKTKDNAYVFADPDSGRILKFYLDKKVLCHLFYQQFTSEAGATVTYEHIVRNGTNYIDLGDYVLSNSTLKLIGVDHRNWALNGSFELGTVLTYGQTYDPSGWHERWNCHSLDSSEHYIGSQSVKVNNTKGRVLILSPPLVGDYVSITVGRLIHISLYAKANETITSDGIRLYIFFGNSTYSHYVHVRLGLTTSWNLYELSHIVPSWATKWKTYVGLWNTTSLVYWFDGVAIDIYDSEVCGADTYEYQYIQMERFSNYTDYVRETWSPSITIGSNIYSHSGELANETESQKWPLDFTSGIIPFTATVHGSGQVKVRIQGTKSVGLTNAFIRNEPSTGVFSGTYYGTPSITTTTYLIVLSQKEASITSLSYASDVLTFTVNGYSGLTSTTEVYCGDKGEPITIYTVNGTLKWSCARAPSTTILTLNVTHESPTRILVYWKFPGNIDGDGDVDIQDLFIFAVAYGSHVGDPTYNSDSDINGDGDVDAEDLYIYVENYGKTNP